MRLNILYRYKFFEHYPILFLILRIRLPIMNVNHAWRYYGPADIIDSIDKSHTSKLSLQS